MQSETCRSIDGPSMTKLALFYCKSHHNEIKHSNFNSFVYYSCSLWAISINLQPSTYLQPSTARF